MPLEENIQLNIMADGPLQDAKDTLILMADIQHPILMKLLPHLEKNS